MTHKKNPYKILSKEYASKLFKANCEEALDRIGKLKLTPSSVKAIEAVLEVMNQNLLETHHPP